MFSRMRLLSKLRIAEAKFLCRKESSDAKSAKPYHLFFEDSVQMLLQKITKPDYQKVFRSRAFGSPIQTPVYKFLTTEDLEEEMKRVREKASELLQMPPVMEPRKEINEVLSVDSALDGHDIHHAKFVFTDVSHDIQSHERTVVVREPDGVLREANWSERHRMNQIYAPLPGRELVMPKMFEDENLMNVLDRGDYEFILDRACAQFEPDDPVYVRVTSLTYERINEKGQFETLTSTRHFGSLAFYLILNNRIDDMLVYFINSKRLDDAYSLVKLYHIIHPKCSSAKSSAKTDDMGALKEFIKLDAKKKDLLELTLAAYIQNEKESENIETGIQQAHGLK